MWGWCCRGFGGKHRERTMNSREVLEAKTVKVLCGCLDEGGTWTQVTTLLGVTECWLWLINCYNAIQMWEASNEISWSSSFILEIRVILCLCVYVVMDLEKLFRRFLWNAGDSAKGKAKVTWSSVCKPKDQGGLGIKPLHKWNEIPNHVIDNEAKDKACWVNSDNKELSFSTKVAWTSLRGNGPQVYWTHYSIWCVVHKIAEKPSNNNVWRILLRLIVSATVYFIWHERNKRNFQDDKRSANVLCKCIEDNIENMLRAMNVKKSNAVLAVAKAWGLQWSQNRLVK
nr:hypothetical protein [Tanacetum cinerariifolium]